MRRPASAASKDATTALALAVMAVAATVSGCSFMFSEGAPADHGRRAYFTCAESLAPPIVDTVVGGLFGLSLYSVALGDSSMRASTTRTDAEERAALATIAAFALL